MRRGFKARRGIGFLSLALAAKALAVLRLRYLGADPAPSRNVAREQLVKEINRRYGLFGRLFSPRLLKKADTPKEGRWLDVARRAEELDKRQP